MIWGMFFDYFYDVIIRSTGRQFDSKFFWDSWLECESSEFFIEFLAFLVQTLCQKIPNISGIP